MLNKQQFKRHIHKFIKDKDAFERKMLLDSKWEEILFDELRFLRFIPETQIPVGPYNVEEIVSGIISQIKSNGYCGKFIDISGENVSTWAGDFKKDVVWK